MQRCHLGGDPASIGRYSREIAVAFIKQPWSSSRAQRCSCEVLFVIEQKLLRKVNNSEIRDSENWFFDYESVKNEFAGITMPSE